MTADERVDAVMDFRFTVIREELETPLQPATIRELKWSFEHRCTASDQHRHALTRGLADRGQVFSVPRFTLLYRRWLKHGDPVFDAVSSTATAEALAAGTGRVECLVLLHTYRHLSPLVDHDHSTLERVEKGLRTGNREGNRPAHVLNPDSQPVHLEPEVTVSEQLDREWHRLTDWYNEQKKLRLTP